MSKKGSILFPVEERPEPNSRSYYGEDVTKNGNKRRVFDHTKLFRINSIKLKSFKDDSSTI